MWARVARAQGPPIDIPYIIIYNVLKLRAARPLLLPLPGRWLPVNSHHPLSQIHELRTSAPVGHQPRAVLSPLGCSSGLVTQLLEREGHANHAGTHAEHHYHE